MYKIWFVNFSYYSSETFDNLDEAIDYGKSKGFDFRIDCNGNAICSWSIIGGLANYVSQSKES